MNEINAKKAALRREVHAQIKLLPDAEKTAASAAILAQTLRLPAFAAARTVAPFSTM